MAVAAVFEAQMSERAAWHELMRRVGVEPEVRIVEVLELG